jgi:hypothetical protein
MTTLEALKKEHEDISLKVDLLEKLREFDRSTKTKINLIEMKKKKLNIRDEIFRLEREQWMRKQE